jgi:type III secretory pathway component EscR
VVGKVNPPCGDHRQQSLHRRKLPKSSSMSFLMVWWRLTADNRCEYLTGSGRPTRASEKKSAEIGHSNSSQRTNFQKRHDLSNHMPTMKTSIIHWRFHMFWIAFLGLVFSAVLIKLGFLSATAGILAFVVKLLLFVIVTGLIVAAWFWLRKKVTRTASQN